MNRNRIERRAEELLQRCEIAKPPVPVRRIAAHLGLQVVDAPPEQELSGFLLSDPSRKLYVIGVNASHHRNRQRYTIAHEIGHCVLGHQGGAIHVDPLRSVHLIERSANSSTGLDPNEVEANAFAAALLMPKPFIEAELARHPSLLETLDDELTRHLAAIFQVSKTAMSFRLANLGFQAS